MNITMRAVREDDAGALVELMNPIIEAGCYTVMDQPLTVDDQRAFIHNFPKRGVYLVAICAASERIIGAQDILPHEDDSPAFTHVGDISTFIALDFRQRGIGSALMRETIASARQTGFRKLMATVRADNPHAVNFYSGQGFTQIGTARHHAHVGGVYYDQVLLERWIGDDGR